MSRSTQPRASSSLSDLGGVRTVLRERIVQAAEGNPSFFEEMLALVRDSGGEQVEVPPTIQALESRRPTARKLFLDPNTGEPVGAHTR